MSVIAPCSLVILGHHFLDILWGGHLATSLKRHWKFSSLIFEPNSMQSWWTMDTLGVISRWKFLQTLTGAGTPAIFPIKGKRASCSLTTFLHYDSRPIQGFWEDAKVKDPRHTLVDDQKTASSQCRSQSRNWCHQVQIASGCFCPTSA